MKKTLIYITVGIILVLMGVFITIESNDNTIQYAFILAGIGIETFAMIQIVRNSFTKK
jgi:hypothetical protein